MSKVEFNNQKLQIEQSKINQLSQKADFQMIFLMFYILMTLKLFE